VSYPGPSRNPRTKIISWPLEMGSMGCPETSARNYRYTLCNIAVVYVTFSSMLKSNLKYLPDFTNFFGFVALSLKDNTKISKEPVVTASG
jgi:hypothetical protein